MTIDYNEPRELNTLLGLKTYQGMTDEEIDILFNYKLDREIRHRITDINNQILTMQMETIIAQNKESCKKAQDALQSILNRKPVLHSVGGDNE